MATSQAFSWKPRFSILGFISGGLFGGGGLLMMQQTGRMALTPIQATNMILSALIFGVAVPTMIHWIVGSRKRPLPATVAVAILAVSFAVTAGAARPAAAQGCSLTVNGQTVSTGSTVIIAEAEDLTIGFNGAEVTGGSASVTFGPVQVYTDSFTLPEAKSGSEERTFDRSKIADKGVGLYSINGVVNTTTADCAYDFLINVKGDPLGTPAGKGAAAALGLGAFGSLAAIGKEIASAVAQAKASLG